MNKFIAIIPARAGSVGIKDKNIKPFCGYPLFLWSLVAALRSKYIKDIVISSNYNNIREYMPRNMWGKSKTVKVMPRPEELCTSTSTTESCLIHVLENVKTQHDYVVLLQPTSPVRLSTMIDDAIEKLLESKKKSLLSVEPCTPFFIQKLSTSLKWHFNREQRKMRQDLDESEIYYHDDGNLYITEVDHLLRTNCRLDEDPYLYINDSLCSYQIDTPVDFIILENIMKEIYDTNRYVNFNYQTI